MVVKYILEGLDCANCAAKIEEKINKISGVKSASLSFFTGKLVVEITDENTDELLKKIVETIKKEEPDVIVKRI